MSGFLSLPRRRPLAVSVAIAALMAVIYMVWVPQTTDLAAQTFRAGLWERAGFVVWNPEWYSGHLVPGYSLLYPPLGAWFGAPLVGAVSAVAAAWLFGRLAIENFGERAWLGVVWFGLASAVPLYSGRTTFALGLAIALAALLAVSRDRPLVAAIGGVAAAAASLVAGLFLALACAAVLLADRFPLGAPPQRLPTRGALGGALGSLALIGAVVLAFPSGGFHPFGFSAFIWVPLLMALVVWLAAPDRPVLVWGAILYLGLTLGAVVFETALGGNVTRLAATFGGPLLAILLIGRRPVLLALVALPLLFWQWETTVKDVVRAETDPAAQRAYFEPLLDQLAVTPRDPGAKVVHIPPTQSRWEAAHVAEEQPIARGWLRQAESDDFPMFREGRDPLEPEPYLEWLRDRGVGYVAVPDADPDYLAELEVAFVDTEDYPLDLIWESENWRLYEVPPPDQSGFGNLLIEPDGFRVRFFRSDRVSVPLEYSPYLQVVEGSGCVSQDPDDPRRILLTHEPGPDKEVVVEGRLSLAGLTGRERHCSTPEAEAAADRAQPAE